ncbi:MAG: hypothetical protein HYV03_01580 [Deltaproteobacteria bacterium]|nr:hypothetical protein [Deltaproteobacteria bacterium]
MAYPIEVNGYTVSTSILPDGPLAQWLVKRSEGELRAMDRGDESDSISSSDRPRDKILGPVELLQNIVRRYEQLSRSAVRAGMADKWEAWERHLQERDRMAGLIKALGWEPMFHIADRDYNKRIVTLLRSTNTKDPEATKQLYTKALAPWSDGGLCLGYPAGVNFLSPVLQSAEMAARACTTGDLAQWGSFLQTGYKVLALLVGAAAVYSNAKVKLYWVTQVDLPIPAEKREAHGFQPKDQVPYAYFSAYVPGAKTPNLILDPAAIITDSARRNRSYPTPHLWRGAMAAYYYLASREALRGNANLAPRGEKMLWMALQLQPELPPIPVWDEHINPEETR